MDGRRCLFDVFACSVVRSDELGLESYFQGRVNADQKGELPKESARHARCKDAKRPWRSLPEWWAALPRKGSCR